MPTSENLSVKNFSVLFPTSLTKVGVELIGAVPLIVRYYKKVKVALWPSSS